MRFKVPKLDDLGISKDQSSRWQKLAGMSESHFEAAVETAKQMSVGEPLLTEHGLRLSFRRALSLNHGEFFDYFALIEHADKFDFRQVEQHAAVNVVTLLAIFAERFDE
jgi:hypothetical protein